MSGSITFYLVSDVLLQGSAVSIQPWSSSQLSIPSPPIYHHYQPPPPKAALTCLQCVRGIIVMRLRVGSLATKVGGLFAGQHQLPRSSCSSCSSWEPHWRVDRTLVSLTAASACCRAEKRGQTTDEEPRRA